jgi:hypothetical protein
VSTQDSTADVDDIWFRTGLSLIDIGRGLGLTAIAEDSENYWAWIIGELEGRRIDVTRTHRRKASSTDTRIFVLGDDRFIPALRQTVVDRLHALGISPVHYGTWKYLRGNDFDKVAVGTSRREP